MLTLLSSLILSGIFCTSAFAAVITPSRTEITVPKGTDTFSFDVILQADKDFAGAEFGLLPASFFLRCDTGKNFFFRFSNRRIYSEHGERRMPVLRFLRGHK